MGRIDINNYEAFLLDLSEGNLADELQVELELFLIQHPELQINLCELPLISLEHEIISFLPKNNLKKSDSDLISETQFIAYVEKQLPRNECLDLEKSCALNSSLDKELSLFRATVSIPNVSVIYPDKKSLKRKPKVIWFNFSATHYAAAACILFLIGLIVFRPTKAIVQDSRLAVTPKSTQRLKSKMTVAGIGQSQLAIKPTRSENHGESRTKPFIKNKINARLNDNPLIMGSVIQEEKISTPVSEQASKDSLLALNVPSTTKPLNSTVVNVIVENEEEVADIKNESGKKSIWATASRALRNLNHAGIKSVNGDENSAKEKTGYAITLGGLNITHKPAEL